MLDLLITDAAVLLPDGTVRSGQTVEIENGIIKDVRPFCGGDLAMEAQERLDGTGKLVMPGLADCHMLPGSSSSREKFWMPCP